MGRFYCKDFGKNIKKCVSYNVIPKMGFPLPNDGETLQGQWNNSTKRLKKTRGQLKKCEKKKKRVHKTQL